MSPSHHHGPAECDKDPERNERGPPEDGPNPEVLATTASDALV